MNILILNWRDPKNPLAGGAEISLFEHAKYWKNKGANIQWVASSFPSAQSYEEIEGIKIYRHGSVYTVHVLTFLSYIARKYKSSDVIVDCIHFVPYLSIFYPSFKKITVVGLINEVAGKLWFSNLIYPFALIGYIVEPIILKLYRRKTFITGSKSARDDLLKLGFSGLRTHVIDHGVNIKKVDKSIIKEQLPTILFLGRISSDKGIKDAFRIVLKIFENYPNVKFWIAGKEERKGIINSLLDEFGELKNSTTYFGFVSEQKKFELYKRSWVLIHPSQKEGWGLNVIEAASQSTPTVGYDVEGLRDSIKNMETGILVTSGNIDMFANKVIELISNKELYKKLSRNCPGWANKFSWEESGEKSWNILQKEVGK